ncbi:helix-turn-helix domain-containing protein [Pyxidicoccus sp. 3LFB2]
MAVVAVARGETCHGAARALACAASTVASAVRRFREEGCQGLEDRRAGNGEAKVDEGFLAALARALEGTPEDWGWCRPTWTRELLVLELERRGRQRVSVATMGRALARLGAGLKAAKPTIGCPWPRGLNPCVASKAQPPSAPGCQQGGRVRHPPL